MERQPIEVTINGEDIELTPENTSLIKYIGQYAIHDHVRLSFKDYDDMCIFNECEGYEVLTELLEDNEYPMAVNVPSVSEKVVADHYDLIKSLSNDENEDIEIEVEKWRRLFEN